MIMKESSALKLAEIEEAYNLIVFQKTIKAVDNSGF